MSEKPAPKIPDAVLDGVRHPSNVVLLTHVYPDGDAIGSMLAFAWILEQQGKRVFCFMEEPISTLYSFLPGVEKIQTSFESLGRFVQKSDDDIVTIALDGGDSSRLGRYEDELLEHSHVVVIDHHRSHKNYGDVRWVDATMSSTGQMVYELATLLEFEIPFEASVNIYAAICTDTGSFRYECTSSRTLTIAADLVERGVRPETMARHLYDNISLPRLNLLQRVLGTMEIYGKGQLAVIHVTSEMLKETGATIDDVEGFVDYPRSLESVIAAVFIKSIRQDTVSVSLRAKGDCDVAVVAEHFGGGGHRNAAGFRFRDKSLEEVKTDVLKELFFRLGLAD
jgi:bifunctional oligoribonuclease and PAP phosphatase NrnA